MMYRILTIKLRALWLVMLCTLLVSCGEDTITPSDDNHLIAFPQGNHDYDQEIVEIYNRYGTQMLYRYNSAMMRWQVTDMLGYLCQQADEQYVGQAVNFIKHNCFDFYQPDSLRKYLPYRIYLASDLGRLFDYSGQDAAGNNVSIKDTLWHTAASYGYANLCFGITCSRLPQLSADSLQLAKGELNAAMLAYAIDQGFIAIPAAFTKEEVQGTVWYNYVGSYNTYGLLEYIDAKTMKPVQDFALFLKYLIAYPTEKFNEQFTVSTFDTSGRIAKKADVVRQWMKEEYGIDLEQMAEKSIQ